MVTSLTGAHHRSLTAAGRQTALNAAFAGDVAQGAAPGATYSIGEVSAVMPPSSIGEVRVFPTALPLPDSTQ